MRFLTFMFAMALLLISFSPVRANIVGVDVQNFNPTSNGIDFVTVQSSETLHPGILNLGLFLNHAYNSLPYTEDANGNQQKIRDQLLGLDLNVGLGVFRFLDLGLSIPHIIFQKIDSDAFHGEFVKTGMTEVRPNVKVRFFGDQKGGMAMVLSTNINQVEDNPYVGSGSSPGLNAELAVDTTISRLALGLNLGYRMRNKGKTVEGSPIDPMENQYIGSAAASFLLNAQTLKLIAEIYGSAPTKKTTNFSDRSLSAAEALLGLKYDATTNLALHAGAGTELMHGVSSPDLRVYIGLNYTMGPLWHEPRHVVQRKAKRQPKPQQPKPEPEAPVEEPVEVPAGDNPFAGPVVPGEETIVIQNVMFAFDKDNIVLPGTKNILQQLAEYLHREPVYKSLVIEGHTDYMGTDAYNQDLSERRAATIRRYLIEKIGEDANKITSAGYGESRPISDNNNYQGRQLNRRVEFKITR